MNGTLGVLGRGVTWFGYVLFKLQLELRKSWEDTMGLRKDSLKDLLGIDYKCPFLHVACVTHSPTWERKSPF